MQQENRLPGPPHIEPALASQRPQVYPPRTLRCEACDTGGSASRPWSSILAARTRLACGARAGSASNCRRLAARGAGATGAGACEARAARGGGLRDGAASASCSSPALARLRFAGALAEAVAALALWLCTAVATATATADRRLAMANAGKDPVCTASLSPQAGPAPAQLHQVHHWRAFTEANDFPKAAQRTLHLNAQRMHLMRCIL